MRCAYCEENSIGQGLCLKHQRARDAMDRVEMLQSQNPEISRRDFFAAMAMQGLVGKLFFTHVEKSNDPERHAKLSVLYADALIAELDLVKK